MSTLRPRPRCPSSRAPTAATAAPHRALVRAMFAAGELLFCGHHAGAHEERLSEIGATLIFAADG
jgi:hypothetical protein